MARDVVDFLAAMGWWWIGLMSGCIGLGLGLWEKYRGETVKSAAFAAVALLAVILSCFMAWRAEHEEVVALRKLSDVSLDLSIDQFGTGHVVASRDTGLLVFASVRNSGAETSLDDWRLRIVPVTGTPVEILPTIVTGAISLGGPVTFGIDDYLPVKTEKPLARGAITRGVIPFFIDDQQAETLLRAGTKLEIRCSDVRKAIHTGTHTVTGQSGRQMFFPKLGTPTP